MDTTPASIAAHSSGPVERTCSEWFHSACSAAPGVYQPEFAGNKADGMVSTCQDCHMRDVSGQGCNPALNPGVPVRADLPLHDMTGGSTWIQLRMAELNPEHVDATAAQASAARAAAMLGKAAALATWLEGGRLRVRVTNRTGHKLPTGYPEGRRIWLDAKFFDGGGSLLEESGACDAGTGELAHEGAKVYEVHPGIGGNIAGEDGIGLPAGPSLHFVLNNEIYHDNRIPPRGFTNAAFAGFGGAPVGHACEDGHYWDDAACDLPAGTRRVEVQLCYQSTSKEFVEFLRDQNTTNTMGQEVYNLWSENGKCPPVTMASAEQPVVPPQFAGLASATPGVESATLGWEAAATADPPATYQVFAATASGAQDLGHPLLTTGALGALVAPLPPGTDAPLVWFFVVRATDARGVTDDNTVELAVQPLPDPAKDQDGDGMCNAFEQGHGLDPFDPADALEDPDRDGLGNLAECAFGSDPRDGTSARRPQAAVVDVAGVSHFALRSVRSTGNPTAVITAEVSGDLVTWQSGPGFTTIHQATDNGDGTETLIERMLAPVSESARHFMRLRVTPRRRPAVRAGPGGVRAR